jgi:hypothetical protein
MTLFALLLDLDLHLCEQSWVQGEQLVVLPDLLVGAIVFILSTLIPCLADWIIHKMHCVCSLPGKIVHKSPGANEELVALLKLGL